MELVNLKGSNLTMKESRDIIKFIAQKRGISAKQLLSTIKPNPKRKNDAILTTKTQKNSKNTTKSGKNTTKNNKNTTKSGKNTTKSSKT